jgi:hypothetical protein
MVAFHSNISTPSPNVKTSCPTSYSVLICPSLYERKKCLATLYIPLEGSKPKATLWSKFTFRVPSGNSDKLLGGRVAHEYVPCDARDKDQSVAVQGDGESWDAIGKRLVHHNELGDLALRCWLETIEVHEPRTHLRRFRLVHPGDDNHG